MAAMITIANANALHIPMPDRSVQCIVTSPPYYGLRDYGVSNQIGLEATPAAYVANIVAVMRECWRVLKDDGVLWLNLGDSYTREGGRTANVPRYWDGRENDPGGLHNMKPLASDLGMNAKNLIGIPWRVAFALQDDGWYLRQDIIWHKPNPMPESVTDRCTKAHEYVFLLTKQARYYYDAEAIKETAEYFDHHNRYHTKESGREENNKNVDNIAGNNGGLRGLMNISNGSRNRRSVWTVATQPYSGSHFAVFPMALIEPMILAGTSQRGECPHCGKAWVRNIERVANYEKRQSRGQPDGVMPQVDSSGWRPSSIIDNGWNQQCSCPPHEPIPQTVLDPFAGSGTTGSVAVKHGRRAMLLDLNTKYIDLQFERTNGVQMVMPD